MVGSPLKFITKPVSKIYNYLLRRLSKKQFSDSRFSKLQLSLFAIIFAVIGGTILYFAFAATSTKVWDTQTDFQSATLTNTAISTAGIVSLSGTTSGITSTAVLTAATSPTFGSFENGLATEFGDISCGTNGGNAILITSPVREGKYAGKTTGPNECYGSYADNLSRVHLLKFAPGTGINMDAGSAPFWWAYSLYIPSGFETGSFNGGPEIHQPNTLDPCTFGPAPFNMQNNAGNWRIIFRGASGCATSFQSSAYGLTSYADCNNTDRLCKAWANGVSPAIQPNQWYDFLVGFNMRADNTGWVEAWVNGPNTGGNSVQIIPRTNLPTSFTYPGQYPMDSLYYSGITSTRQLIYDGGRFSNDFNGLKAWQDGFTHSWGLTTTYSSAGSVVVPFDAGAGSHFSGFTPTATVPAGTSITYEARSSCDQTSWSAWGAVDTVPDGRYLQVRANLSTTNTSITPSVDKISIGYDPANVCGSTATTVNSSINNGDQVTNGTVWTVGITPAASSVEFWADGTQLATDTTNPYSTVINLADGTHRLGICATVNTVRSCYGTAGVYATVTTVTTDTTAPTAPANIAAAAVSSTSVNLTWTASTDNVGVAGYKIYRATGSNAPTLLATSASTAASYSDTTAQAATSYSYQITAYDAAGNESGMSLPATVMTSDTTAPTTPTNFTVTAQASPIRVNLSWTASTDNVAVTGYKVYRGQGSTTPALLTTVTSGTSYTDTAVSAATSYSYQVSAIDAAGNESAKTAAAAVTTPTPPDTSAPTTPANFAGSVLTSPIRVSFTWTASTDNVAVTGYKIYRGLSGTTLALLTTTSTTTTYTDTTAASASSYAYQISAIDAAGNESVKSAVITITTPDITPPTTPTNLAVLTPNPTTANLTWSASFDNVAVSGYKVYRGTGSTAPTLLTAIGVLTSYSDTTVSASTSYTYRVSAVDAAGNESIWSSAFSVATPAIPDTTAPVAAVTAPTVSTKVSGKSVTVSANATDNVAVANVQFYLDYQGNPSSNKLGPAITSGAAGVYSYTWDTTTIGNGNHTITAIAVDTSTNSAASSAVTTTVDNTITTIDTTAPSVPSGVTVGAATSSSLTIAWAAASDNIGGSGVAGYIVYQNTSTSSVAVAATDQLKFTATGLQAGSSYSFSVASIDNAGNVSAKSRSVIAKTSGGGGKRSKSLIGSTSTISAADMSVVLSSFGDAVSPYTGGDLNGDGVVDIKDLSILLSNYGGYL